jgi:hypothetical protein
VLYFSILSQSTFRFFPVSLDIAPPPSGKK